MNSTHRPATAAVALAGIMLGFALPASAASPLAALPIGSSVKYHVTTQSNTPENGQQSASHYVSFMRTAETTIQVTVDGAPSGNVTITGDGSVNVPANLKSVLAPFGEIALYMRGAPKPLSPNASWAANLPVPIKDQTDNVPVVLTVTQLGPGGATISASGGNDTSVQPKLRSFPADVSVSATIRFTPAHTLASATRTVGIAVKVGRIRDRSKNFGSSWTITPN